MMARRPCWRPCIVRKKPQVPNTARQAACLPGDIWRGKRSSMPQPKTSPDSPVPSLQEPCDRSRKSEVPCGSCLNWRRSEEHTSELQSPKDLVCRLLLEKKKERASRLGSSDAE